MSRKAISSIAPTMSSVPITGKILYRPVREVTWPAMIDATMIPPTSGSMRKPASVGVAPRTICRNCGSSAMPPNIPTPITMPGDARQAEDAVAEQPQRQQRVVAVGALGQHEQHETDDADDVADDRAGGVPAPLAALLGHDQQRHERHDERERARPVDAVRARDVRDVEHAGHDDQRDDPDRDVHEEDPAPPVDARDARLAGQHAADHRAEHARGAEHREEVALVPGPLPGRDDVAEDRQGQRHQATGAEALHARGTPPARTSTGERAQHRADDEDRDRGQEERLAAVDVGQLAVERGGDRAGDEERRGGPGLQAQPVEVVGDGADRGGDDRLVERGEEHPEHQPDQDRQHLAVAQLAGRRRRW